MSAVLTRGRSVLGTFLRPERFLSGRLRDVGDVPALVHESKRCFADEPSFEFVRCDLSNSVITKSRGMGVLHDPCLNKGTGHSMNERERMGLRGLLPPKVSSLDEQIERNMERFRDPNKSNFKMTVGSKDPSTTGITDDDLRKWGVLTDLQDRNETLF